MRVAFSCCSPKSGPLSLKSVASYFWGWERGFPRLGYLRRLLVLMTPGSVSAPALMALVGAAAELRPGNWGHNPPRAEPRGTRGLPYTMA